MVPPDGRVVLPQTLRRLDIGVMKMPSRSGCALRAQCEGVDRVMASLSRRAG
jgi:hypothetical protein